MGGCEECDPGKPVMSRCWSAQPIAARMQSRQQSKHRLSWHPGPARRRRMRLRSMQLPQVRQLGMKQ